LPAAVAGACPLATIKNQLQPNRYAVFGDKGGVTTRWASNGSEDDNFGYLDTPDNDVKNGFSRMNTMIFDGVSSTTSLHVQAVITVEVRLDNNSTLMEGEESPFDPYYDYLRWLGNGTQMQDLVTSGHSFKDVVVKAGKAVYNYGKKVATNYIKDNNLDNPMGIATFAANAYMTGGESIKRPRWY
jgi:hypothetical protein